MKLFSFLPVFAANQLKIRPTCDSLPQDQIPAEAVWNCVDGAGEFSSAPFKQSDKCHVSGTKCSGTKFCHKGEWRGKIKCKKDCYSTPNNPMYGGDWDCDNGSYGYNNDASCRFYTFDNFTCDTSGVSCNTVSGNWRGKTRCRYSGERLEPLPRPNGDYSFKSNGKSSFNCNDGTSAGRMFYDRKAGRYIPENNWYYCCPALTCENGTPFSSFDDGRILKNIPNCPGSACDACNLGFHQQTLYNYSSLHYDYICASNCICENGSPSRPDTCSYEPGTSSCESCNTGYELLQETCVLSEVKEQCYKADPVDIVFVVDGSGSVSNLTFVKELNLLKSVSAALDLGSDSTRIALIQYDHITNIEFNFIDDSSKIPSSFANITQLGGGTATGSAITYAYENIIENSARPGVQVKIVVVTDGQSYDDVKVISDEMRNRGIEMIAVGFGNYDLTELQDIANNPDEDYLFTGSSADELSNMVEQVTRVVCQTDVGANTRSKENLSPIDDKMIDFIKNSYVEGPETIDEE